MANQDWKAKNYNKNIRVSEQTVQKLRANKTFAGNVAAYKKSGGDKQTLEAMNRFYGKTRVSKALGGGLTASKTPESKTVVKGSSMQRPAGNKTTTVGKVSVRKTGAPSGGNAVGNFVKNELLGVDDFSRVGSKIKKGDWWGATKSLGTGLFELGTTTAAVAAAIPTGGASLGAKAAMVAAKQGAKAAGKQAAKQATRQTIKQTVKTATVKGVAKSTVKSVSTGSIKQGAKNVRRVVGARPQPIGSVVRKGKIAVGKQAEKYVTTTTRKNAIRSGSLASERATKATKTADDAAKAQREAKKTYEGLKASRPMTKAGKPSSRAVKGEVAAKKAYDTSKATTATANKAARNANKRATTALSETAKREAARKAAKKQVRGLAKRGAIVHTGAAAYSKSTSKKGKK